MRPRPGAVAAVSFSMLSSFTQRSQSMAPSKKRGILDLSPQVNMPTVAGTTFKINQIPNPNFHGTKKGEGAKAMAKAYLKYGAPIPNDLLLYVEQLLAELLLTQEPGAGEVAATPEKFDSDYVCPVQIGTPPQTLNLDFDTASSDLWVLSSETPINQIGGHTIYNIGRSSTAQLLSGESWNIIYGDGSSSSGNVYNDIVSIGGITVESQAVESATSVSLSLTQRLNTDGIVGLAFSTLNTVKPNKKPTFFENAMPNLASPLFTANLRASEPGNYNFGFIDPSEFIGPITYVPVNMSAGFWQFTTQGFKVGDTATVLAPHEAIADTATTLLLVPDDVAAAYYAQIPGSLNAAQTAGGYVFPCSAVLPSYTAVIGPYQAVVPGNFMRFSPVDGDTFADATMCFGGIQVAPLGLPFAIYGDVFLKSQFVVFHGGDIQLGLATKPL
ncbi:eukaryotic aspartyl protease [Xylaria nigripes]|nr:eukaryotic aspartyl protease [Xylaria nigripes]